MKKTTVAMQIAEEIATRIGKGILHPGQHLVEATLAEEFNTSRAPVREALLMLESDGLVQRIPHHGVVVRHFTRTEIYELYDVIYRLEEIAMEKAIAKITTDDITRLEEVLRRQEQAVSAQDVQAYYDLNEEFHALLFTIGGNRILSDMYRSLRRSARPFRMLSMAQGDNLRSSLSEHQKQVEALRSKNVQEGKLAIREQELRSLRSLDLLFPV
ncbi:GntR family transcriptional regulator [Effusibacillus dendaii]|uniref:GntR family transcriptional regulator n=1 Tax=Effusibacillus dendaii TaxID=2743772 RepID=A0A7I8D9E2_9BACL|nr:GntR family transcriptional regulator [Effusibacillus dendaii]BCJ85982.1 GntR family transcriptional regulator [Effusibacillus dendaii]